MLDTAQRREHLKDMLKSSEELIRSYDLKSEIAMLCFVLSVEAINVLVDIHGLAMRNPTLGSLLLVVFLVAMTGYLAVIAPVFHRSSGKPGDRTPASIFFVPEPAHVTPESLLAALDEKDFETDAARQVLVLAELRNIKNWRLNFALGATAAFYAILLLFWLLAR
ncbi:MAG: hypothetical protein AB7O57_02010 [Hyphomicrobiaceae bacterium]